MNPTKPLGVLAILAALTGCTVGPNYHTPPTPMPGAFTAAFPQTQPTTRAATTQPVDIARWWKSLGDPELDSLVQRAVAANPDLEIALTRLQEARTQEAVIAGVSLPDAEIGGGAARGTGSNSVNGRVPPPLYAGTNTTGLKEVTEAVGFGASWELDLFGKYRRAIEAARGDTQAAAEARNAVLIALVADVARTYVNLRTLQLRLSIARDDVRTEQQSVNFVQARFDQGITNELDVALARRQLSSVQATVAPLESDVFAARRRIAVLLGRFPEDLAAELAQPRMLPQLPDQVRPGLPIDLLRRRPDIRQAERQLAATTARIGAATADLFPSVVLSGALGMQGQGLGRVPASESFIWSAGPAAYWPVLDFGTLDALATVRDLQAHAALVSYKRTILAAVEEVNDAISNYAAQQDRLDRLGDALVHSQRAMWLATQRYDRGLTDYLNVLDAQRQYYDLQDQYASAQEALTQQFVGVYTGLGGGWEDFAPAGPPPRPRPAILAAFDRTIHPDAGKGDAWKSAPSPAPGPTTQPTP